MKRFVMFLATLMLLTCATSCKNSAFDFDYSFAINGTADGDVSVMFPGGQIALKGSSELGFAYSSAPEEILFRKGMPSYTTQELRDLGKKSYSKVAGLVEDDYEAKFTATSMDGTYYLHITGTIHEKLTGLDVKIDKVLTNKPSIPEA